jgi:hypothetical protein
LNFYKKYDTGQKNTKFEVLALMPVIFHFLFDFVLAVLAPVAHLHDFEQRAVVK